MKTRHLVPALAVTLLLAASPLSAQTGPDPLDRFSIGIGSFIASNTTIVTVDGDIPGTEVDFEEALDLDDSKSLGRFELDWRFADRHQIGIAYYSLDRSNTKAITGEIVFDDVVYPVDTVVEGRMNIDFYDVSYTYWVYRAEDKAFGIKGGLVNMSITAGLQNIPQAGEPVVDLESEASTDLPVPGIGGSYRQMFGNSWLLDTKIYFLPTLSYEDYEGDTLNATAAMEYRFLDHYGVGAAYSFFGVRAAVDRPNFDGSFSYKIRGGHVYLRFYW